jgi:hypothetical protein
VDLWSQILRWSAAVVGAEVVLVSHDARCLSWRNIIAADVSRARTIVSTIVVCPFVLHLSGLQMRCGCRREGLKIDRN